MPRSGRERTDGLGLGLGRLREGERGSKSGAGVGGESRGVRESASGGLFGWARAAQFLSLGFLVSALLVVHTRWMARAWPVLGIVLLSFAGVALALPAENPWPRFKTPVAGAPRSIGDYSAGCIQGAAPLPLDGPGYQVMHPSRLRYFGHPSLVDYITKLGAGVRKQKLGVVLVGDLSQPRGGRATGGHSSHQSGLDVDVWFWFPKEARRGPLSMEARETTSARSVLAQGVIRPSSKAYVTGLLRLAVDDARVDRVFVNPIIKRELCTTAAAAGEDRAWLRKLRPWHGHDDHFHARLACPTDSTECKAQAQLPQGDGCDQLDWWFDEKAQAERKKAQAEYQHNVVQGKGWPAQCEQLLSDPEASTQEAPADSQHE
jgi:penicillin-insensitive murein endopeptidase